MLKEQEDRARQHPDDPWYRGLRAMAKSAVISTSNSGKLILDPTGRGDGALVKLKKAMEKLEVDLMPQEGLKGSISDGPVPMTRESINQHWLKSDSG